MCIVRAPGKPSEDGLRDLLRAIRDGDAIREAALDQVRLFSGVIRRERLPLRLVGVGGLRTVEHVRVHIEAGSHAVQLATAAMLDPMIGLKIRTGL